MSMVIVYNLRVEMFDLKYRIRSMRKEKVISENIFVISAGKKTCDTLPISVSVI